MAQIISIGLQTWVSSIYQNPYAVMKLRFFRHTAILTCQQNVKGQLLLIEPVTSYVQDQSLVIIHALHT